MIASCRLGVALLGLALLVVAPAGCSAPQRNGDARGAAMSQPAPSSTIETSFQMGTLVRIEVAAPDLPATREALDAAFAAIDEVVAVMSEWELDSDISRVNAAAGGEPVVVDPSLIEVLRAAHRVSEASEGAFDVTWAPLRHVWCFDAGCDLPDAAELAEAVALVDYTQVELDAAASTVRLARAGMEIGLGSIAKGYALRAAGEALRARGFDDWIIDGGGDVYAHGDRFGAPWGLGVADPAGGVMATVEVRDAALVTSGSSQRYIEVDGVRYHHLLDVRTGMPARGTAQVTVACTDPTVADALATAAFVLGPQRGVALLERWDGAEGLVVGEGGDVSATSGWGGAAGR